MEQPSEPSSFNQDVEDFQMNLRMKNEHGGPNKLGKLRNQKGTSC